MVGLARSHVPTIQVPSVTVSPHLHHPALLGARPASVTSVTSAPLKQPKRLAFDQTNEVAAFLRARGFHRYTAAFLREGFDELETLACTEDADLRAMGIPERDLVILKRHLRQLRGVPDTQDGGEVVTAFLQSIGLLQYADAILGSGFDDMETFLLMDANDMKDVGILRGHVVKLQRKMREYELEHTAQDVSLSVSKPTSAPPVVLPPHTKPGAGLSTPTDSTRSSSAASRPEPTPAGTFQFGARPRSKPVELPEMKSAVDLSWEQLQGMGSSQVSGLIIKNFFEISPESMALFPPDIRNRYKSWDAEDLLGDSSDQEEDEKIVNSPALRRLFGRLLNVIGCSVTGLLTTDKIVPMLFKLGGRHVGFGVKEELFPLLGRALDSSLEELLGDSYTGDVRKAWSTVYGFMSNVMIQGFRAARSTAEFDLSSIDPWQRQNTTVPEEPDVIELKPL